ncbi:MAG: hypothetical protein ACRC7N_18250 [Clostridium sp.]
MEETKLKIKKIIKDIFKALAIGGIINIVLAVLVFLISLMIAKGNILDAALGLRSVILLITGISLLFFGGLFIKGIWGKPLEEIDKWRDYFNIISFEHVFFIVIITFIISANIIDSIIRLWI